MLESLRPALAALYMCRTAKLRLVHHREAQIRPYLGSRWFGLARRPGLGWLGDAAAPLARPLSRPDTAGALQARKPWSSTSGARYSQLWP